MKRALLFALIVCALLIFPAYTNRLRVSDWLESATGEADPMEQVKGIVKAFRQRPVATQVMARLDLPPPWTHSSGQAVSSPPDNLDDYGDFVAAVVARYQGKIAYYQIWNEPNLVNEWGKTPDAQEYTRLLKTAYQRAKAI